MEDQRAGAAGEACGLSVHEHDRTVAVICFIAEQGEGIGEVALKRDLTVQCAERKEALGQDQPLGDYLAVYKRGKFGLAQSSLLIGKRSAGRRQLSETFQRGQGVGVLES